MGGGHTSPPKNEPQIPLIFADEDRTVPSSCLRNLLNLRNLRIVLSSPLRNLLNLHNLRIVLSSSLRNLRNLRIVLFFACGWSPSAYSVG